MGNAGSDLMDDAKRKYNTPCDPSDKDCQVESATYLQDDVTGETALMQSIRQNEKYAKDLLNKKQDLDIQDKNGYTALMNASMYNKKDLAEMMITTHINKCNINKRNNFGESALDLACKFGHIVMFNTLINHGAKIKIDGEITTLHHALNSYDILVLLIDKLRNEMDGVYFEDLVTKTYFGQLVGYYIKQNKINLKIFDYLLGLNPNLNAYYQEQTPLMTACEIENFDIVKKIIEKGCDINIETEEQYGVCQKLTNPILIACSKRNLDLITLLIENKCNHNVYYREVDIVTTMYATKKIMKTKSVKYYAFEKGYKEIYDYLGSIENNNMTNTFDTETLTLQTQSEEKEIEEQIEEQIEGEDTYNNLRQIHNRIQDAFDKRIEHGIKFTKALEGNHC